MRTIADKATDADARRLLRDLRALVNRADQLSRRLDRDPANRGKLWAVKEGLRTAKDAAEWDLAPWDVAAPK